MMTVEKLVNIFSIRRIVDGVYIIPIYTDTSPA